MSKSVLIIDTPESCVMCPLSYYNERCEEHQCRGTDEYRTIKNWYQQCVDERDPKPEWCPLTSLPPRKVPYVQRGDTKSMTHLIENIIGAGYNKCLDDLQKGASNEK